MSAVAARGGEVAGIEVAGGEVEVEVAGSAVADALV